MKYAGPDVVGLSVPISYHGMPANIAFAHLKDAYLQQVFSISIGPIVRNYCEFVGIAPLRSII